MSSTYKYHKIKHADSVQHIGIRRSKTHLETQEVIVENNGTVKILESTHHVPSGRTTFGTRMELTGDEGAEEARCRIDEMFYHWVN